MHINHGKSEYMHEGSQEGELFKESVAKEMAIMSFEFDILDCLIGNVSTLC